MSDKRSESLSYAVASEIYPGLLDNVETALSIQADGDRPEQLSSFDSWLNRGAAVAAICSALVLAYDRVAQQHPELSCAVMIERAYTEIKVGVLGGDLSKSEHDEREQIMLSARRQLEKSLLKPDRGN